MARTVLPACISNATVCCMQVTQVAVMMRQVTLTCSAAAALRTHKHGSLSAGSATNESDPEKAVMELHVGNVFAGWRQLVRNGGRWKPFQRWARWLQTGRKRISIVKAFVTGRSVAIDLPIDCRCAGNCLVHLPFTLAPAEPVAVT